MGITVGELRERLAQLDQNKEIWIWYDSFARLEPEIETGYVGGVNRDEECYIMEAK